MAAIAKLGEAFSSHADEMGILQTLGLNLPCFCAVQATTSITTDATPNSPLRMRPTQMQTRIHLRRPNISKSIRYRGSLISQTNG